MKSKKRRAKNARTLVFPTPGAWQIYLFASLMLLVWVLVTSFSCTPPDAVVYLLLASTLALTYLAWRGVLDRMTWEAPLRLWLIELLAALVWALLSTEYGHLASAYSAGLPPAVSRAITAFILLPSTLASTEILLLSFLKINLAYSAVSLLTPATALLMAAFTGHIIRAALAKPRRL